jgi:hypothetical protein
MKAGRQMTSRKRLEQRCKKSNICPRMIHRASEIQMRFGIDRVEGEYTTASKLLDPFCSFKSLALPSNIHICIRPQGQLSRTIRSTVPI